MASKLSAVVDKLLVAAETARQGDAADEEMVRQNPLKHMRVAGMTRREAQQAAIEKLTQYQPDGWEEAVRRIREAMR